VLLRFKDNVADIVRTVQRFQSLLEHVGQ